MRPRYTPKPQSFCNLRSNVLTMSSGMPSCWFSCWRTQPAQWPDRDLGIILAAGAGALGVQLGRPVVDGVEVSDRAELGLGDPADVDFMQSAVGLVWRATVLWMLLLFLLGLATLVG